MYNIYSLKGTSMNLAGVNIKLCFTSFVEASLKGIPTLSDPNEI